MVEFSASEARAARLSLCRAMAQHSLAVAAVFDANDATQAAANERERLAKTNVRLARLMVAVIEQSTAVLDETAQEAI